jgi:hypothetical protein
MIACVGHSSVHDPQRVHFASILDPMIPSVAEAAGGSRMIDNGSPNGEPLIP